MKLPPVRGAIRANGTASANINGSQRRGWRDKRLVVVTAPLDDKGNAIRIWANIARQAAPAVHGFARAAESLGYSSRRRR